MRKDKQMSTIIEPTNGRIVWYRNSGGQPWAAIVVHVWHTRLVNLAVFTPNGSNIQRTKVRLVQDGDVPPNGPYCEWMPHQNGQAAKAEAEKARIEEWLAEHDKAGDAPVPRELEDFLREEADLPDTPFRRLATQVRSI
jgi:hypothetical protein